MKPGDLVTVYFPPGTVYAGMSWKEQGILVYDELYGSWQVLVEWDCKEGSKYFSIPISWMEY